MSCGCECCEDTALGYFDGLGDFAVVDFPGLGFIGIDARAQATIAASGSAGRVVSQYGGGIYVPGTADCAASGQVSGNAKLAQTGGNLALTGLQTGLVAAGAASLGVTVAIAGVVGLFNHLFSHHAAAVKREQNVLCTAVPAANNYFDIIDQAYSAGYIDAQHALAALDSLDSDFRSAVSGIYKDCNAACVMQMALDAAIATEKAKYTELAQQQAAAAQALPAAQPPQAAPTPVTAPPAPSSPAVVAVRPNTVQVIPPGTVITPSSYSSFYAQRTPAAPPAKLPAWLPIAAAVALLLLVRG